MCATSFAELLAILSGVVSVSSTTSCSRPAAMQTASELHVREDVGHFHRVDQIRLARMADLSLVLQGRNT
jgi:hypothetical protein